MADVHWRKGWQGRGVKAEVAFAEFERIREQYDDLTPELVVLESRSEDAPLHNAFEWDDEKAGEFYRRQQARGLINGLVVHSVSTSGPLYVNVVIRNDEEMKPSHHYMPVRDALEDPAFRGQVLNEARSKLKAWRERYGYLKELAAVTRSIDEVIEASRVEATG